MTRKPPTKPPRKGRPKSPGPVKGFAGSPPAPGSIPKRPRRARQAEAAQSRRTKVIQSATEAGFLSGHRERIAGRLPENLVRAAKERSGLTSDTALLEYAVARVALEDKFVETLLSLKGTVPPDLDLEF